MLESNIKIDQLDLDLRMLREEIKKHSKPSFDILVEELISPDESRREKLIKDLEEKQKQIELEMKNRPSSIIVRKSKNYSKIIVRFIRDKEVSTNIKVTGRVVGYKATSNSSNLFKVEVFDNDGDDVLLETCTKARKRIINHTELGYIVDSPLTFKTDCDDELTFILYIVE